MLSDSVFNSTVIFLTPSHATSAHLQETYVLHRTIDKNLDETSVCRLLETYMTKLARSNKCFDAATLDTVISLYTINACMCVHGDSEPLIMSLPTTSFSI